MLPLFSDRRGTTVAYSRCGKGEIIYLSESWPLSNSGIDRGDNLILVLNALSHRDPKRALAITFDEYHHGYNSGEGIVSLLSKPARLGLALLGAAFLLLVFSVSRRFGRPIELKEGARQRGEYLSSMSSLLHKARATDLVRRELGKKFLADCATALGLPPNVGLDQILQAAAARCPDKVAELEKLGNEAISSSGRSADEATILAWARSWHKMRKELTK